MNFGGLSFALTWSRVDFLIKLSTVLHVLDILVLKVKYNMTCHETCHDMIVMLFAFLI